MASNKMELVFKIKEFIENEADHALWTLGALPQFMFIGCGEVAFHLKISNTG